MINKHNIGLTPDEREFFEERAAIRQYDAGFAKEEAERLARLDVMKLRAAMRESIDRACG